MVVSLKEVGGNLKKLGVVVIVILLIFIGFNYIVLSNEVVRTNNLLFNYTESELMDMYNYYMRNKEDADLLELEQGILQSARTINRLKNSIVPTFRTRNINKSLEGLSDSLERVTASHVLNESNMEQFANNIYHIHELMDEKQDNNRDITTQQLRVITESIKEMEQALKH